MKTCKYITVLDIKGKHNFKLFFNYIHIIEIPTNKGANSYTLNITNKRESNDKQYKTINIKENYLHVGFVYLCGRYC